MIRLQAVDRLLSRHYSEVMRNTFLVLLPLVLLTLPGCIGFDVWTTWPIADLRVPARSPVGKPCTIGITVRMESTDPGLDILEARPASGNPKDIVVSARKYYYPLIPKVNQTKRIVVEDASVSFTPNATGTYIVETVWFPSGEPGLYPTASVEVY